MRKITHSEVHEFCQGIINQLEATYPGRESLTCYPVPRGGIPVAYALGECGRVRGLLVNIVDTPEEADFILDDLIDSGATRDKYSESHPSILFLALISKPYYRELDPDHELCSWLIFPWEDGEHEESSADDIPTRLLQYVGEDPERGGLVETPKRFLKAWQFWTKGYAEDAASILKTFEDGAEDCNEMVVVKNIPAYSKCEHHLADIFGVAHVAYIPDGKIVGLSKLNRLVDMYGRRLQVQERWTNQIANALETHLKPKGVAVVIEARHMCIESRGIQHQGCETTTSAMRGVMMDDAATRSEFLRLIGK